MVEYSEDKEEDLEDGTQSEVYDKEALTAFETDVTRAQVYALLSIAAAVRELADVVADAASTGGG